MKSAKSPVLEKKFPTLIGLTILLGALVAGVFFIGSGPGIFSPRATPETTPSQVKITNVTENSFSVSFLTTDVTTGFLKYGTSTSSLRSQASDDRDQLTGNVGTYNTHHITVRGLQPETTYYFTLGTGSDSAFDNNGQPYSITTGRRVNNTLAQTVYGTVLTNASTPAEGTVVYVTIENSIQLSTLVRSSGTWAIPLVQLRSSDGNGVPQISSNTPMTVFVQGKQPDETAQLTTTVGQPQLPIETITLGQATVAQQSPTAGTNDQPEFTASGSAQATNSPTPTPSPTTTTTTSATPSATPQPTATASASAKPTVKPTATPTSEPSPTPTSATVSMPATDSAKPVSGNFDNTLFLFVLGLSLTALGIMIYIAIKPAEVPEE